MKMSTVSEATLSFKVIPIKIMVAYLRNSKKKKKEKKKKKHNINLPPQKTPDSKSVLEEQERVGRSTFLFQTMSQTQRIKQCGSLASSWLRWLSI